PRPGARSRRARRSAGPSPEAYDAVVAKGSRRTALVASRAAMKVLITGGAGFIGSHLADRLLAGGHEVRAFDNLDPQVHATGERPDYLDEDVELVVGDVRDRDALRRALDRIDTVVHFAAAVGVGQSMYEIERYTSINAIGAAVLLEEVLERRDAIRKLLVASSMSIYGEGQYRNPRIGKSGIAPGLRPEAQLAARRWDVLGDDGLPLEPGPTAHTEPLRPRDARARRRVCHRCGPQQGRRARGRQPVPGRRHPALLRRYPTRRGAARFPRRDPVRARDGGSPRVAGRPGGLRHS